MKIESGKVEILTPERAERLANFMLSLADDLDDTPGNGKGGKRLVNPINLYLSVLKNLRQPKLGFT